MLGGLVRRTFASVFVAVLAHLATSALGAVQRTRLVPRDAVHEPRQDPQTAAASAPAAAAVPAAPVPRRSTRIGRLARAGLDVSLVLALGFTVFVAYGLIGNRWYHVVAIEGGSMEPAIKRGDLIVVTPAPAKIEAGMILVIGVDGRMVTHRVIEVHADGSLVTQGDANPIPDQWQGKPIEVFGQYQFAIPAIGHFLPISNSGASFADVAEAGQRIKVGSWATADPTPDPLPARASVRIEPGTITIGTDADSGRVSVLIKVPAPHDLKDIEPASIVLCHGGTCLSNPETTIDGTWLRATFATSDVVALFGRDRGKMTLTVRGEIGGYAAGFVGYDSVTLLAKRTVIVVGEPPPGTRSVVVNGR